MAVLVGVGVVGVVGVVVVGTASLMGARMFALIVQPSQAPAAPD
jgi:hypothetical protein